MRLTGKFALIAFTASAFERCKVTRADWRPAAQLSATLVAQGWKGRDLRSERL